MKSSEIDAKVNELQLALELEAAKAAGPLEASFCFGGRLGIEVRIVVDRNMDSVQVDVKRWLNTEERGKKSARVQLKLCEIPTTKPGEEPVMLVFRDFDKDKAGIRERPEDLT